MTDHRDEEDPAADIDPGPPLALLRGLEEETGGRFLETVHARVDRRVVAGQFVQLFGVNVVSTLFEYISSAFQAIGRSGRRPPGE